MSKLTVSVLQGPVKFFPAGMFHDSTLEPAGQFGVEVHPHHPVQPLSTDASPEKIREAIAKFFGLLENIARADAAAPAIGSASEAFKPRVSGEFTVTCDEGLSILRVYHAQSADAATFGRESAADPYVDLDGNGTTEAWTDVLLFPGQERTFKTIENNAVTVAIYS